MKAILVIDMPGTCVDCDLSYECRDCKVRPEDVPYDIAKWSERFTDARMSWCPLRPLPEKMDATDVFALNYRKAVGWNECLDAITGGDNDTK